ncbi:zonular occludens toxin domain-containing protein [Acidithiobacillus thiooxidans]|uniref:zonular occludens toxin domain-containing protein n=1 Tax=Acidithiobacillus thiooxidans TaxID=930 RepID=UPI00068D81C4|nr:zonular occludens toxin domain-containing protein [Acidithiobacillus thiooxidans]
MITLRTGLPGAGKTLFAIHDYIARPPLGSAESFRDVDGSKEPIQVFASGVPFSDLGLAQLPVTILDDPTRWMDCPPGSVVIIDECQRIFRSRPPGAPVPDYVAALETHRHLGIDLVFITQDPMLLDKHVRRLVGQHYHSKRTFGLNSTTMFFWQHCCDDPNGYHEKKEATKARRKLPKKIFPFYKSAEVHTVKRKIPFRVWATLALLLALPPLGWFAYDHVSGMFAADTHTFEPGRASGHAIITPRDVQAAAPAPMVFQSTHPLQQFNFASVKLKRAQLNSLPLISEKFRIVGKVSAAGGPTEYVLQSRDQHYVTVYANKCETLDGLEVCRFAGGYVSVDPTHGRVHKKRKHNLTSSMHSAAAQVQNVLP